MINVSSWSIKNPIPAILLFILLTIAGFAAFSAMKIQQFMDIDLPLVVVTAVLPGGSPAQMETEVARKIENAVASINGIKHIYSQMQDGVATVRIEFRLEKGTQEAVDDVRDAISRIRSDLPADLKDPVISRVNLSGAPILTYAMKSSHLDDEGLSWFIDNTVNKTLLSVKGVGKVSRVGGVSREVAVNLEVAKLLSLNTSAAEISRALRETQQEASGGRANIGGAEQSVRTIATVKNAGELANLFLNLEGGRQIRLGDVAEVIDTIGETRQAALLDGKNVVGFEITRSVGASEIDVDIGVQKALNQLISDHPDLEITKVYNLVDSVRDSYVGSMYLLLEGAILAVFVVFLFLRDFRATFISATALPLSIIPTFACMYLMGFSLNVVTLLSMSLVVGILVDDAIVEIENIMRHLGEGKSPYQAAMEAADEIGLAVIATTFTLIAVFLPTAFMSGITGRFFVQFGWTAAISVFFSLVVARLLTPMMAAYILKPILHAPSPPRWLQVYEGFAKSCLAHKKRALLATTVFFIGSLALIPFLPGEFMPPDDMSLTQVSVELPPGATFDDTFLVAESARKIIAKNPYVTQVYSAIGGGSAGANAFEATGAIEARTAKLTVNLLPRNERSGASKKIIENQLREALKDLPSVRLAVGMGHSSEKYILVLSSENGELLASHARAVERDLRSLKGVGNIVSKASLTRPEVIVRPDFAKMSDLGVTSFAIADTLRVATAGDYDQSLAKLNLAERQIPIVVRLPKESRQNLALLSELLVRGGKGYVRLGNVATLSLEGGPAQIERYDRQRNINFEIELAGAPLGEVAQEVAKLPSIKNMPTGVTQSPVGDVEAMGELFRGFSLAIGAGILCIYIVLVLLFKDFVQPVTILAALVLSVPGAFLALFITHTSLSMPSMIGLIMLMGIATKNSILLVDYVIIARRDHGKNRFDALIDACKKRARPIIMTTIAMGAGMLPIAMGFGVDPSFRSPMAIVVIGGLITSTFLSLLIIPVIFSLIDEALEKMIARYKTRLKTIS